MAHAAERSGLYITSAEYLWLPCPAPRADILIVDESIIGRATERVSLDPRLLAIVDGFKPESIASSGVSGGIELFVGTDDENYGGTLRPLPPP
jgi:hypothetical protein